MIFAKCYEFEINNSNEFRMNSEIIPCENLMAKQTANWMSYLGHNMAERLTHCHFSAVWLCERNAWYKFCIKKKYWMWINNLRDLKKWSTLTKTLFLFSSPQNATRYKCLKFSCRTAHVENVCPTPQIFRLIEHLMKMAKLVYLSQCQPHFLSKMGLHELCHIQFVRLNSPHQLNCRTFPF